MAFSDVGIAKLALQRLGAKSSIVSLTDGSTNAGKVSVAWEYVLKECLETIKPKFAITRVSLAQGVTDPANTDVYEFAYPLPADYLALAEGSADDPAIWPSDVAPYVIETLSDGSLALLTNYDTTTADYGIYLTYVKYAQNPALYTGVFVNALVFRLAAELAFTITEGSGKFEAMITLYEKARRKASGVDRRQDYLADEKSNEDWSGAGR